MLLIGGSRAAAQELWLRKVRIHTENPPGAGTRAPKTAAARAVPRQATAAQLARRERSQRQLRQKWLARKMWASVRIASRLLAWRFRACKMRYVPGCKALIRVTTQVRGYWLRGWPRSCGYAI